MTTVTKLAEVLSGLVQNVDLTASDLVTNSVWVGGTSSSPSVQVTPTLLNSFLVSPMTTAGDMIYENGTPAPARLPIGTTNQVLTVVAGVPTWASPATGGTVTTVSVVSANGMAGTVANASTTPAITLTTTVSGILSGNGTAISAASTTGTGAVVLAASPTVTGTFSATTITASGAISSSASTVSGTNLTTGGHASADLATAGGTMSGAIAMGANKITGLADGSASGDAVTYDQAIVVTGANPFTSAQSMGSNKLTNVANGSASGDAVNFSQLTAISSGLVWVNPVHDPDLLDDSLSAPPGSPYYSITYIIAASPTGAWAGLAGHAVWWDGYDWVDISTGNTAASGLGTAVQVGDRFLVAAANSIIDSLTPSGGLTGKQNYLAQVTTNTPGSFAYTFTAPVGGYAVSDVEAGSQHFGSSFTYSTMTSTWVDFAGPAKVIAGAGLEYAGNTLNVQYDNATIDVSGAGGSLEVKSGGIGTTQLAALAITAAKLGTITDGTTLDQSGAGSTLEIKTGGVGTSQLAGTSVTSAKLGAVTGAGLTGGSGSAIAVNFDNATIDASGAGSTLEVKVGGISATQLASGSVLAAKLGTVTDGTTLDQSGAGATIEIKAGGVGTTQLASSAVTAAKLGSVTDGSTLDQLGAGSTLEVKSGGIGTTQLASSSVTIAKLGTVTDGITLDQSGASSTLEIKTGGVGTSQLASQAVTAAKLATSVVDGATLTGGNGTALSVLYAPAITLPMTSGVTMSANTSYIVRMALTSETAGRIYLADASSAVANNKFWGIGMVAGGSGVSAGNGVPVTIVGVWTLGSSDTPFSSSVVGLPVWLTTSGGFSTTAPSTSGYAAYKVGIVQTTTTILLDSKQLTGIA